MHAVRDVGWRAALHRRECSERDCEAAHRPGAVGAAPSGHDPAGHRWGRVQSVGEGAGGPVCDRGPVCRGIDAVGYRSSAAAYRTAHSRSGCRHGCGRCARVDRHPLACWRRPRARPKPHRDRNPPAIDGAVSKALAKAPPDRFVTAAQFAEALTPSVTGVRLRLTARRILAAGAVTAAVGALVLTVIRWRAGVGPVLDPNLV